MKNSEVKSLWLICFLPFFLFFSCAEPKKRVSEERASEFPEIIEAPDFNEDSACHFIEKQVSFGPRVPNTPAHMACADYLQKKLKNFGAEVIVQDFEAKAFDGKVLKLRNIIGSYLPDKRKRILLCAHWDTRPFADKDTLDRASPIIGANDGGSGVAVLLELARIFGQRPPKVGVDIIFFDGEDYGIPRNYEGSTDDPHNGWCLGSRYWSENKHEKNYFAYYGILLDMVGGEDATFFREGGSMQFAPKVVKRVWDIANRIGYGKYFVNYTRGGILDDHVFVNKIARIPTINIVQFDANINDYFGSYHHTHRDNMTLIDGETLKAVGQTLVYTVYSEKEGV